MVRVLFIIKKEIIYLNSEIWVQKNYAPEHHNVSRIYHDMLKSSFYAYVLPSMYILPKDKPSV